MAATRTGRRTVGGRLDAQAEARAIRWNTDLALDRQIIHRVTERNGTRVTSRPRRVRTHGARQYGQLVFAAHQRRRWRCAIRGGSKPLRWEQRQRFARRLRQLLKHARSCVRVNRDDQASERTFLRVTASSAAARGLGDPGEGATPIGGPGATPTGGPGASPAGGPGARGDKLRAPRGDSESVCERDMERKRDDSALFTAAGAKRERQHVRPPPDLLMRAVFSHCSLSVRMTNANESFSSIRAGLNMIRSRQLISSSAVLGAAAHSQ